jgi:hypothetical protein
VSPKPAPEGPGCCELGDANLAWFPASPPAGAWHPASFRWDPRVDVPVSEPLDACPFCGRALVAPGGRRDRD